MSKATLSYSFLQGTAWAIDGCLYGYSSVYLLSCGLSNTLIGILLGASLLFSFLGQIVLGEFFNRLGKKSLYHFFRAAGGFLLIANLLLFLNISSRLSIILFIVCCLFIQLFPAFINSAAVSQIQQGIPISYGIGRGSGSIGYAVCSAAIGQCLPFWGTSFLFLSGFLLSALFLAANYCFFRSSKICHTCTDKNKTCSPEISPKSRLNTTFLLKYKAFGIILLGTVFVMTGHTYVSNYLFQIVSSKGGNEGAAGIASAIAACCEVPALFLFDRIRFKLKSAYWLKLSCIILTLKIVLAFLSHSLLLFQLSELLQLGFGLFTVSSVYYTSQAIPRNDTINSQAYLNASSTLGVFLSLLSGGVMIDHFGTNAMLFVGVLALSAGSIIIFMGTKSSEA